jgi:hypothetical protein
MHSSAQRLALRGLLEEVGYVGALVARETPRGLELIDGEMRMEETPDTEVPVLIVDLDDDEMRMVLATYDPIGELARRRAERLSSLLARVQTQNADVRRLLTDISETATGDQDTDVALEDENHEVVGMALEPHEHYDFLVVLCTTTHEWNVLCDKLQLEPVKTRRGSMGTCRAIRADRLLTLLADAAAVS